jgi:ribosomal-protein-alanine N-acetyltransferase
VGGLEAVVLDTPRLRLRPVAFGDEPLLFQVFSDPVVMRYWSTPPWTGVGQAEAMVRDEVAGAAQGTSVRLAVLLRAADDAVAAGREGPDLIGTVSVFQLDRGNRRAELGYALRRSAWGHGYAREAVAAVVDHAFDALDLIRIEADVDPRNHASARLLERLGFRREGLLRQRWIVAGEVCDSAWYGLLREDWQPVPQQPGTHQPPGTGAPGVFRQPDGQ